MPILWKALRDLKSTLNEVEQVQPTQQPGSISEGGKLITAPLERQSGISTALSLTESPQAKTSCGQPSPQQPDLIAELISAAWLAFPRYGEDESHLIAKIKMFQMVLAEYPDSEIKRAFKIFLKEGSAFPIPADIVRIIEPPKEKLSAMLYFQLKRHQAQGHYIWDDREKEFMQKFEDQEYDKLDSHTRRDFENEITVEKQKYLDTIKE